MDGDVGEGVAVGDGAALVVVAHDGASGVVAGDAGVGEDDVFHLGTVADSAEEALRPVGVGSATLVDADAADDVVLAVEGAAEVAVVVVAVVVADGLVVAVGVTVAVGVSDVGFEAEVLAAVVVGGLAVGAVDAVGEQVELVFIIYKVGVGGGAGALGGPVDGGEGSKADGHILVGHQEYPAVGVAAAEGACAGVVAVVAVAVGCGGGVGEGEAQLVATAVVECAAALEAAAAVGGDAADGVLGRGAGEGYGLNGDISAGGDGAGGLALCRAHRRGIVAVVDGGAAATHEGGAVRDGCPTCRYAAWGIE